MNRKHWRCGRDDCHAFGFIDFEGEADAWWMIASISQDHDIQNPNCDAGIGEIAVGPTQDSEVMDPVADIKLFANHVELDDGVVVQPWQEIWFRSQ